jgi:hypothetical protein
VQHALVSRIRVSDSKVSACVRSIYHPFRKLSSAQREKFSTGFSTVDSVNRFSQICLGLIIAR